MSATRNPAVVSESVLNRSFVARCRDLMERAYAHLSRKPDALYDERQGKVMPFPVRHIDDYRKAAALGADKACLLDAHELVGVEAESIFDDDPSRIDGRAFLTLEQAYEAEFAAECEANLAQLVAIQSGTQADKERALQKTLSELRTLKQYARVLRRELDAMARSAPSYYATTRPAS